MDNALIQETLGNLLKQLALSYEDISIKEDGEITRIDITSNEASRIIGWHGETLNAVQHILKGIIRSQEKLDRAPFLLMDVDGYRRMQEEKVCSIAEQKADFVRRTGNRVALAPMSPYFRRIVHLHIANHKDLQDLETESVGEGDYRQVVLRLKNGVSVASDKSDEELSPVIEEDDGLENLDI
jgi:spoIIIJ-associated protein